MMRSLRLLLIGLCFGLPAAGMRVALYDVSGLVLEADSIVLAERLEVGGGRYRVRESLLGALAVGAEVMVQDGLHATSWQADEREVVLFLRRDEAGTLDLVSGGLWQHRAGQMFRFAPRRNPVGFEPEAAGVDLQGLLREVRATLSLLPRLAALPTLTDPAKRRAEAQALLPFRTSAVDARPEFSDPWAHQVLSVLFSAGDLEGALMLLPRDRTRLVVRASPVPADALLTFAESSKSAGRLRARALTLAGGASDVIEVPEFTRRAVALLDDDDALVRAAAASLLSLPNDWSSSEPGNRQRKAQAAQANKALANRFAREPDVRVLGAIATAWRSPRLPLRKGGPDVGAQLTLRDGELTLSVVCLGTQKADDWWFTLVAKSQTATETLYPQLRVRCGGHESAAGPSAPQPLLPPGDWTLVLEARSKGKKSEYALGSLRVSGEGPWEPE